LTPIFSDGLFTGARPNDAAPSTLAPERIAKLLGESGCPSSDKRTQQEIDRLDLGWAIFDDRDRLRACNEVYTSWLSYRSPNELIGTSYSVLLDRWLEVLAWPSEEQRGAFRVQRLQGRAAQNLSFDVSTRSGFSLRMTERCSADGWSTSIIVDRSQDARAIAELRTELESCRAAGAAKTDFLCSMSHELRTPLSSMLGFAQLMRRDGKDPLPERQRARIEHILQDGEQLVHMIDDLLDLARIEAGRIAVSWETLQAATLLEKLRGALEPLAQAAGIALQIETPRQDLQVSADPVRALQILMNFGSNAIKYNRPGGSVRLWVSTPSPGQVRATVSDTGVGIPSERRLRIFEPFYRAGQERSAIQGTGLGLALSKRLAELMRGSVGFSSVWMQGSEFWLDLPQASSAAAVPS
jgi:signal transduction histidine kinase